MLFRGSYRLSYYFKDGQYNAGFETYEQHIQK